MLSTETFHSAQGAAQAWWKIWWAQHHKIFIIAKLIKLAMALIKVRHIDPMTITIRSIDWRAIQRPPDLNLRSNLRPSCISLVKPPASDLWDRRTKILQQTARWNVIVIMTAMVSMSTALIKFPSEPWVLLVFQHHQHRIHCNTHNPMN